MKIIDAEPIIRRLDEYNENAEVLPPLSIGDFIRMLKAAPEVPKAGGSERKQNLSSKFVVIFEIDTGYMECIALCDNAEEAYGHAYLRLQYDMNSDDYYLTMADRREGENGFIMECINKKTQKAEQWCTVLFFENEESEAEE